MTTTTQQTIPGAPAWAQPTWISEEPTGLDWLDELRERHAEIVAAFAAAVEREHDAAQEQAEMEFRHREAVRRELAAGRPAPAPPDPVLAEVRVEAAREDVGYAEDAVAEIGVQVLAQLRRRRSEIGPAVEARLSPALRKSLLKGPGGRVAQRIKAIRDELRRIEQEDGGPIVDVGSVEYERRERERRMQDAAA
jgi:hypothetical protein